MRKLRFTEAQITYALRQAESGTPVPDVCRQLGCNEASFYLWKKRYGNLGVSELREIRQLRDENARLKRLVGELTLDKHILGEVIKKNSEAVATTGPGDPDPGGFSGQHRAGLRARAVFTGVFLPQERGKGSVGIEAQDPGSGAFAISIRIPADSRDAAPGWLKVNTKRVHRLYRLEG